MALAPDASSAKAGRDLANAARWESRCADEGALWGACKGSGSKPYQTQIDTGNIAFKCSCPSRKFPCKHGLGLMLLYARQPDSFTKEARPQWVSDWLDKRTEREEKKSGKKEKPVHTAAQAKRADARQRGVEDGIAELLLWMKDIVRNGILSMPEKKQSFFKDMAGRMVDAKAPGLAGMVKELGGISYYKEGWQSVFMDQLSALYLVATGFLNRDKLPAALKEDILSLTGFTQSKEKLLEKPGITDHWLVLGKQVSEDEQLTTERYWLYGARSGHLALVLQFGFYRQGFNFSWSPGMVVDAHLIFFDSAAPFRALVRDQNPVNAHIPYTALESWAQVAMQETALYRVLPVATERPYILRQIKPVQYKDSWWLCDQEQAIVPLKEDFARLHLLLAVTGGHATDMAVLGCENNFEPLGVWASGKYISLA